jgi:peroxiredoxin
MRRQVTWMGLAMIASVALAQTAPPAKTPSLIGKSAPIFSVVSLDGRKVSLADYRGKAVVINFWATWCGNCKLEMPWLARLREKYAGQGFEVLGIVTDNAPTEKINALVEMYSLKYPILECNHATAQAYGGLHDLPQSFFIDRRGKVVAQMDGADSEKEIEANIVKAFGKR